MVILGVTITTDVFEHLSVLRQAPFFFQILLIAQCCIAVNIGVLNASMTAGSDNPVDILMNSMGLLILNDMDNIVAQLFLVFQTKEEEDSDLFAENLKPRDKIFAKWLALGHLGLVIYYGCWFSGLFQYDDPEAALHVLFYFQPYSFQIFPFIVLFWYVFFYSKFCKCCRCRICYEEIMHEQVKKQPPKLNEETVYQDGVQYDSHNQFDLEKQ